VLFVHHYVKVKRRNTGTRNYIEQALRSKMEFLQSAGEEFSGAFLGILYFRWPSVRRGRSYMRRNFGLISQSCQKVIQNHTLEPNGTLDFFMRVNTNIHKKSSTFFNNYLLWLLSILNLKTESYVLHCGSSFESRITSHSGL